MGHSQADKARNRERILDEAAGRIRRDGLDSISVAGLMEAVGLTHGGFYNHFGSRAELLTEALARALRTGADGAPGGGEGKAAFDTFVRGYLSGSHRDHPESGCAIAALAGEVSRADGSLRSAMSAQVDGLVRMAAEALGNERKGMMAVSALIGALTLSRVCTDPERSDALLRAVREEIRAL